MIEYKVKLKVTGMTCDVPGVLEDTVVVDLASETAKFDFKETDLNRPKGELRRMLSEIIESLGYDSGTPELTSSTANDIIKHTKDESLFVTVSIEGMTCSHCTNTVTKALQSLPLVDPESVHVSLDLERATMLFPNRDRITITQESIKELIEDLGYDVNDVVFEEKSDESETESTMDHKKESSNLKSSIFSLSGMTCEHCVKTVAEALKALPDVLQDSVFVSLEKRQAGFTFVGDSITPEKIQRVIEDLGYDLNGKPRISQPSVSPYRLSNSSSDASATLVNSSSSVDGQSQEKKKVVMRVLGMTCQSCVSSVTDALKHELSNVEPESVYVNLQTEMAMFICINPDQNSIQNAIEERGFTVENIQIIQNLVPPAVLINKPNTENAHKKNSITSLGSVLVDDPTAHASTKVTFHITGMTCSSCVHTVERGLEKLPGVDPKTVQVNLLTHTGTFITSDATLDEKALVQAIDSMGYTASKVVFTLQQPQKKLSEYSSRNPACKAEMIIIGMYCPQCTEKVYTSLSKLHGIQPDSIQVNLESGQASFQFTGDFITRQRIRQTILQLGFSAESIKITKTSEPSDTATIASEKDSDLVSTQLVVTGMTCSSCVANIERTLMKLNGVTSCQVNLLSKSAVIRHNPDIIGARSLAQMIEQIGYKAEVTQKAHGETLEEQRASMKEAMDHEITELRSRFLWSLLFAIPVILIAMIFLMALPSMNPVREGLMKEITHGLTIADLVLFILATPVQFWLGWPFYIKAYKSLVYSRTANMETLVAMGTSVAYFASVASVIAAMVRHDSGAMSMNYFETSVLLITFIHLGKWLEAMAKGKTAETITKLMDLQPETAILVELKDNEQEGQGNNFSEKEVACKDIQVGDILKVNAGGRIPCDGKVWKGTSSTDESMITGESVPVNKKEGDNVISATINLSAPIYIRAIRVGSDTTLSRIIQLVQDAQASPKAPIEQLADKISSVFVPIVIVIAIIVFIIWEVASVKGLYSDDWVPEGEDKTIFSVMLAVSVLVIACPCGLGLASPTAVMVGTGVAARYGVLVKGGGYALEMANRITTVAFDKTGTLTMGKPIVTHIWIDQTSNEDSTASQRIGAWKILGRVSSASNHPLSKAIEKKARYIIHKLSLNPDISDNLLISDDLDNEDAIPETNEDLFDGVTITNAQEIPGRGLLATVTLSKNISGSLPGKLRHVRALNVYLGNQEWMDENHARYQNARQAAASHKLLTDWQNLGQSIVLVAASPVSGNEQEDLELDEHQEGCKNACACAVCRCSTNSICCTASKTMMISQLAVADIPRPEARQLIAELRKKNIEVWMITGDNECTGQVIGEKLGIPHEFVLAGVKPEQKADKVRNLQRRGVREKGTGNIRSVWKKYKKPVKPAVVAMVGDGINDSPALAQSDVGISVGSATDIAIEAASIVLIKNNLMDLLTMYDISRVVVRRIRLNFLWAFIYNAIAIPVAAGIFYPIAGQGLPPYIAGLAMVASSVSVVCSSLLLRLYKAPKVVKDSHQIKL
ncbi:hypothetical protein G6F46_010221 [Rhizopus delemar]|nr:hypothetical protein G6F55_009189 [Rhizopus delemar]KAG1537655.1 hypothetical protein G6F51_010243 [Rhizopus arrhizus]KAG1491658.1 hypothetical protein G6F54_009861 [Rhizopus delemar]KAG1508382.1 hypothetical protein G6F53_008233 [Rhizopus delemar]KAG1520633.1 hypothetical protein G6F52_007483 [Rhizopus delemar]